MEAVLKPIFQKVDSIADSVIPQFIRDFDKSLQPAGVQRAPLWQWLLWMGAFSVVALWGVVGLIMCWGFGLNQTNMNDYYGFALWIWADLAVIALGGGAFFSGFLKYVIGKENPLKYIVPYAVVIGFVCYSSAQLILGVDVGQPLRAWFIFWHANVHSMLTEVAFCLSCYFLVLCIEFVPSILENRKLSTIPFVGHLTHNFHAAMGIFAATGAFLSFFHQGSLGGVAGVLYARPFGFREGLYIWPWTFFLFTWSAAAYGPMFTILLTRIAEALTRKKLVAESAIQFLAKVSAYMIGTYIIAKIIDTLYWAFVTAPGLGFNLADFYTGNPLYGYWILGLEVVIGGIVPAAILLTKKGRENPKLLLLAAILAVIGVSTNRWVMVLQVMAVPVLEFDKWVMYFPSWQEIATTVLPVAYGVLLISAAHRYLPLFPYELEQVGKKAH
ncbi:MAG: polysulfide reductase NrfD [Desulfatibacillaceae bacterium]|nr:polysulfide reductase NrfD [Desulfatibacillaceae bacterium]